MERIMHLMNTDTQRFIMVGGLMGSGKSTLVNEFEKNGYKVVCPDRIRVEMAQKEPGNENKLEGELVHLLQNYETKVWAIVRDRIKRYLTKGESVIFDATNVSRKSRKQVLSWGTECNISVIAVYIECPLEIAQERNLMRGSTITGYNTNGQPVYGRTVPGYIIENAWKNQVLPTVEEGFKEVYILHVGLRQDLLPNNSAIDMINLMRAGNLKERVNEIKTSGMLARIFPDFLNCWDVDQENKYHNLKLHEHMIKVAEYVQHESMALFLAALLHDIGKAVTKHKYGKLLIDTTNFKAGEKVEIKEVKDKKGFIVARRCDYKGEVQELLTIKHIEPDANAHYYNHEVIGAIMVRRNLCELGFDDKFSDEVYQYVLYHMDLEYTKVSQNNVNKLIQKVGQKNARAMIKLKKADKIASAENDIEQYSDNFKQIEDIVG